MYSIESIFLKTQSGGFPTLRLPTNNENKRIGALQAHP